MIRNIWQDRVSRTALIATVMNSVIWVFVKSQPPDEKISIYIGFFHYLVVINLLLGIYIILAFVKFGREWSNSDNKLIGLKIIACVLAAGSFIGVYSAIR